MLRQLTYTLLSITVLTLVASPYSYAKQQACADFEKHFRKLANLEKEFSSLKHKKLGMEGSRTLIKEAGTDLLELRVPLVAMDPQKKRPNHLAKCRSASQEFTKDLPDAQKSLAELRAFGPMLG
ncbi:MAG TPA: hypothetical protein DD412_03555 [Holosporales bacterium]|nr:hypothetical protein [Holosporales bacterium]